MSEATNEAYETYYVPSDSKLPIMASIGIFLTVFGIGNVLNDMTAGAEHSIGGWILMVGGLLMGTTMFIWFSTVIKENHAKMYSQQMNRSFVWGMGWFIFSEVMFFAAFFGALFYVRVFGIDWIAGLGNRGPADVVYFENFVPAWPLLNTPNPELFPGADKPMGWFGLPLVNTILLVSSSVTLTIAHHGIKEGNRKKLITWLGITVALAVAFLVCQVLEYQEAYSHLGLTLNAGIYGTTFFLLTGFHGAHVTLGTFMLAVMLGRAIKGHFSDDDCFGFEAAAWYWHFVDVVWIILFFVVYVFGS
ncbi:MAG: cytochrome c oxidase subunit 3 [Pseudomonadales bacterium]|nr:cytochrome c oxidase subunit 3 [Pseudomonadales bacterium]